MRNLLRIACEKVLLIIPTKFRRNYGSARPKKSRQHGLSAFVGSTAALEVVRMNLLNIAVFIVSQLCHFD